MLVLAPSVPVPAAVLHGDALGYWLVNLQPDCIPPLLVLPVSFSVQGLGLLSLSVQQVKH